MFVNREAELSKLNEMHASEKHECAIIYGRRRVGKTALIKEFIKGKRAVYFLAREDSNNLEHFSHAVNAALAPSYAQSSTFKDWDLAFEALDRSSREERLVVAIDEYPYLAETYAPISSILQSHIDQRLMDGKIFLILCGSSMSFMENQVLGYKSPLYGRRTAQLKILPFSFFEAMPFLEPYSLEDQALLYGAVGGTPAYLSMIDKGRTAIGNIKELFFKPSGLLFEEPGNLLQQELRRPASYNDVIGAIAGGASKLNEIAAKSGTKSDKCSKRMAVLITLGLVRKEGHTAEDSPIRSCYRLEDPMFRFWHKFVSPNLDGIELGLSDTLVSSWLDAEAVSTYMGPVFEEICKQFLAREARRSALPFMADKIGRWWGSDPVRKTQEEIDIVFWRGDSAILCECKWKNAPMGKEDLEKLKRRAKLLRFSNEWLWLFSKSGFDKSLIAEAAKDSRVRLVSLKEMLPCG
jgi:AAA+ ATPase superfamily predicted ATPase